MKRTLIIASVIALLIGILLTGDALALSYYSDFDGRAMDDPKGYLDTWNLADDKEIKSIEKPYLIPTAEISELYKDDELLLNTMGALWYDLLCYEMKTEGKTYSDKVNAVDIYKAMKTQVRAKGAPKMNKPSDLVEAMKTRAAMAFFGAPDLEADYYNVVFFAANGLTTLAYWLEYDLEETTIRYRQMEFFGGNDSASEMYKDNNVAQIIGYCCDDYEITDTMGLFGDYLKTDKEYIRKIYDAGVTGIFEYMDKVYLSENAGEPAPFAGSTVLIRKSGNVNVRKGPDKNSAKVGSAKAGGEYDLLDTADNGWLKIRLENGAEGYISPNMVQ